MPCLAAAFAIGGALAATRRACPEPPGAFETRCFELLRAARAAHRGRCAGAGGGRRERALPAHAPSRGRPAP
jgi:hypothetical protein